MLACAFAIAVAGCTDETSTAQAPKFACEPPESYMNDPAFRAALDAQQAEKTKLLVMQEHLLAAIEEMTAATRAAMPGADDAAVKAELEKKPEWVSLQKRLSDAQAALDENRRATTEFVGARMAPKKISK